MQRAKRRLAAVMCADVAHYTRLMEQDEDGTLNRLKAYREVMSALTERHDGRIVNTWGDAVIIEFGSVVEAVQCAVEIQTELSHRNADLPDGQKMEFRIGLNLGDLMVEGDDIYGDGVNVAARLQQLAPQGGIMLSQSVYDQVRNKLAIGFDPKGLQTIKNVSEPVDTYAVRLGGRNDPEVISPEGDSAGSSSRQRGTGSTGFSNVTNGFEQARHWLSLQPRKVRSSIFMIGFFFGINFLTSGLTHPWFLWPSFPFAAMLAWHFLVGKKESKLPEPSKSPE